MDHHSGISGKHRGKRKGLMWLGVLSLLMSLLSPVTTLWIADAAAAQTDATDQCADGEVWDDASQSCVTDQGGDGGVVNISIAKWICADGAATWDRDTLLDQCEPNTTPITFDHYSDGAYIDSQDGTGSLSWTGQPAGTNSLAEQIPDGYGAPRVFCSFHNPDNDSWSDGAEMQISNGNTLDVALDPNWEAYCDWFNIPAEVGQIHITKYDCANFTGDPTSKSWRELQQDCPVWSGDQVEFQLWKGSAQVGDAYTDANGEAWFTDAAVGDLVVAEALPEGYHYSLVFCEVDPAAELTDDTVLTDYEAVEVQQGSFHDLQLQADEVADCLWFNFIDTARDNITDDVVPDDVADGSQIDFYKYMCPEGLVLETKGPQDYVEAGCAPQPGWSFSLDNGQGANTLQTDDSGLASWTDIAPGSYTGSETVPDGWGAPIVYCSLALPAAIVGGDWTLADSTGNQITLMTIAEGQPVHIICAWFNFPDSGDTNRGGDTSTIDFYKYTCPDTDQVFALGREGSIDDYFNNGCSPTSDWDFTVSWDGGGSTQTTDGDGLARWTDVPIGAWSGAEDTSGGWGVPIVFCRESLDGAYSQVGVNFTTITLESAASSYITCLWFNIPGNSSTVVVWKWNCPVGVAMDVTPSELLETCTEHGDGVDFTLTDANGDASTQTIADGNTSWAHVPLGDFTLTETVPDGWGVPVWWCSPNVYLDENGEPLHGEWSGAVSDTMFGGTIRFEQTIYNCIVFNVPADTPDDQNDSGITVWKWNCPADATPGDGLGSYLESCTEYGDGVDFTLTDASGATSTQTIADGNTSWIDVPLGDFTLTETVPDGWGVPVWWCSPMVSLDENGRPVHGEFYGASQAESFSDTVTENTPFYNCLVYNFPPDDGGDDGTVTIYKYTCDTQPEDLSTLEEWQEACPVATEGIDFIGFTDLHRETRSTDANGMVSWDVPLNSTMTFSEYVPAGYGVPVIWCGYTDESGAFTAHPKQVTGTPASTQFTFSEPTHVLCMWFNVPGDESTITVTKYTCATRPEGLSTMGEWQEACPDEAAGVTFTLASDLGLSAIPTDDQGKVIWEGIPNGAFSITEDIPTGYGAPVVFCGWTATVDGAVYDAFPQQITGTPGVVTGEITQPGTSYFCTWFNIPDESSRIVVWKWNCPADAVLADDDLGSYQDACTEPGDGVDFTLSNAHGESTQTILDGSAIWSDVPLGDFKLTETVPDGWGAPVWFCSALLAVDIRDLTHGALGEPSQGSSFEGTIADRGTVFTCIVFNFPDTDREVTVYKYSCPAGIGDSMEYDDYASICTTPMAAVQFGLESSTASSWRMTDGSGRASWYGWEPDMFWLTEGWLPGYEAPVVFCSIDAAYADGAVFHQEPSWYDAGASTVGGDMSEFQNYTWTCYFFNEEKGPGDIQIFKWNCPVGYNPTDWGADPTVDCTEARDGVDFTLTPPSGPGIVRTTGDDGPGQVFFPDLAPGSYTIQETVPADTATVFIWNCYGGDIPSVHPMPLQWGSVLTVDVAGGDHIMCDWYNVPKPQHGWVTLYKYLCWTQTFTNPLDCEIYEFGASFELFAEPGHASQGVGTTNAGGRYTWGNLDDGLYSLTEISADACRITATKVTDGKIRVELGQETVVKVYNCTPPESTPTSGGKPPTKYPNTGVPPQGASSAMLSQDASDDDQTIELIEPDEDQGTPTDQEDTNFFRIACIAPEDLQSSGGEPSAEPTAASVEPGTVLLEGSDEDLASQSASDPDCIRGSVPARLTIDAAKVNHPVETLEIVDGIMEEPTSPDVVSWYKETARLGEQNNVVIAAHVNWWNVPKGPFYYLAQLKPGDKIQVTGEDGLIYVFEVQWVSQESNLDEPGRDIIGPTDEASLTLITCSGEWNASISEYNSRTVVRAIQVDVIDPSQPQSQSDTSHQALRWIPVAATWRLMGDSPLAA